MLGLAQKKYISDGGKLPFYKQSEQHWPLLQEMLHKQQVSFVDFALAEQLLQECSQVDEAAAIFLCHLSAAARAGHLCVKIEQNHIEPSSQVWQEADAEDVVECAVDWLALDKKIIQGAASIIIQDLLNKGVLCSYGAFFYLQRYWAYENEVLLHFRRILNATPTINIDTLQQTEKMLPEQMEAVKAACNNCLTLISGGPGTGKTFTAGQLIRTFWMALPPEQHGHCEIALAAPTGKAAANLQHSLAQATADLDGFKSIKAKTLHALLGIRSSSENNSQELSADLIVVDESSMIDVKMMALLLAAIKPGARLILLGDPHQLPSVSAGSIFADMIHCLDSAHSIVLKTCLRAELQTLISFASIINKGDSAGALKMLSDSSQEGIKRVIMKSEDAGIFQQELVNYAAPRFRIKNVPQMNPKDLLQAFNHFRILSPLRKGPYGVNALNELFAQRIRQEMRHEMWCAMPIMLMNNDYRLELFNGEVGVLVTHPAAGFKLQQGDYALFVNKNQENGMAYRKIPALLLPPFEYAFCLSVHKSQGSEFDHILLLMAEGADIFGREALYTAVTRARRQLEIWGSDRTLHHTIEHCSKRLSGIYERYKSEK